MKQIGQNNLTISPITPTFIKKQIDMENQTLTPNDLRLLMNMLDQQITIIQMTSNDPRSSESYIRLTEVRERVINQLVETKNK
jgi:hypothetical protein